MGSKYASEMIMAAAILLSFTVLLIAHCNEIVTDNLFNVGKITSITKTKTVKNMLLLTLFFPVFPFDPPENIKKPKVF